MECKLMNTLRIHRKEVLFSKDRMHPALEELSDASPGGACTL